MSETNGKSGELISKYLDDAASDEEVAELSDMLVESPDVAREFAKVSRQDGYLQEHFKEEQAAARIDLASEPAVATGEDEASGGRVVGFSIMVRAIAAAVVIGLGVWWGIRIAERGKGGSPVAGPGVDAVAKVGAASGHVEWRMAGGGGGSLKTGDPVLAGMRIETGQDGAVKLAWIGEPTMLELAGNSKLELGPPAVGLAKEGNSPARRRLGEGGKLAHLEIGKMMATVAAQAGGKPFVVVTPHAEAQVVGTAFDMLVSRTSSELDVFDGTLRYTRLSDGKKLEVRRGHGATAGEGAEFVLRRCKYYPGTEYADGPVLFQDDLVAGLDNWDVLVSTNGRSFRPATSEERARIVRQVQPDDGWQKPAEARGTVLAAGKGETVALRLKKPMPVVPISVEFLRQAENASSIHVLYGDVVEEEMVRELPHNIFEPGGPQRPRREMIPIETRGNAQIVEERRFMWRMPWYIYRIAVAKREGIYVTIGLSGDGRKKAVFADVTIREMKKIEGSK